MRFQRVFPGALVVAGLALAATGVGLLMTDRPATGPPKGEDDAGASPADSQGLQAVKPELRSADLAKPEAATSEVGRAEVGTAAARAAGGLPSRSAKGEAAMSSAALEELVGQLDRLQPGAEVNEAVAALVRQGEAAVAEIGRRVERQGADSRWRHTAVRVLQGVNSEESRAILRRMALGEVGRRNPGLEDWAARALIACDRREAWTLLASTTPQVLTSALNSVDGQPVDEKHMPLLRKCLAHEAELVRWRAADVLADDPTGKRVDETLQAVAQALEAIPRLPNVNAPHRQRPPTGWTIGEACYRRYVNVLARVKADNEALRALGKRVEGRGRDAVLLALARRGDKSVHGDLVKLAQDPKADLFRAWAVTALREIGTPDDLPLLRTLAKTDPLVREGPLPPPHPDDSTGPTHPVRQAAEGTIRALERKSKPSGK